MRSDIGGRRTEDGGRGAPNRRDFLRDALAVPALFTLGGGIAVDRIQPGSLKVVCVGGHPDDPESGCGGTLAMYAAQGHRVTVIYLTRGERGIQGKSDGKLAGGNGPGVVRRCAAGGCQRCAVADSDGPGR